MFLLTIFGQLTILSVELSLWFETAMSYADARVCPSGGTGGDHPHYPKNWLLLPHVPTLF